MDFELDAAHEWLQRRRDAVNQASRKTRQKKKQEREELREQNAHLKQERVVLLGQISSLESAVNAPTAPQEEDELSQENALLREELNMHKRFLEALFRQLGSVEPPLSGNMGELSKQNRDFAMLHFLRILADSQTNREWKRAPFPMVPPWFCKPVEIGVYYHRSATTNVLNLRVDVSVYEVMDACELRDAMATVWEDQKTYEKTYGEGSISMSRELPEFRVESDAEVLKAFHQREPAEADVEWDMVFLLAKGRMEMAKSTLDIGVLREMLLCPSESSSEVKKKPKLDMLGTTQCFYTLRTITEHGDCGATNRRVLSTNLEAMFVWAEEDRMSSVWIFTIPPSAHKSPIGGPDEYVEYGGAVGPKAIAAFQRALQSVLEKFM